MAYFLTDETRESVKRLWQAGKSATEIGCELDMTKNAVIGVANRGRQAEGEEVWPSRRVGFFRTLKTPRKRRSAPKHASEVSPQPKKPNRAPAPAPEPIEKPIGTIDWMDRELNQCAFIEGEVGDVHSLQCCGSPTELGSSWCKYHRFIVYGADVTRKEAGSFRLSRIGVGA